MRADRRFLSELQVSKDVKPTSNPLEATMGASGSGWTPNVGAGKSHMPETEFFERAALDFFLLLIFELDSLSFWCCGG